MKAGTTSVANFLDGHPDVFAPKIKEPNHFSTELHAQQIATRHLFLRGLNVEDLIESGSEVLPSFAYLADHDVYRALYRGASQHRYSLDASTTYFSSPFAAARIAAFAPDARVIVVLRDPFERAWSEFLMNQRIGIATADFAAALNREHRLLDAGTLPLFERYASTGLYQTHLARFRRFFREDQLLVLHSSDLRDGSAAARVCDFLEIAHTGQVIGHENGALVPRFPALNRMLHRSSIKYIVGRRLEGGIKRRLNRINYRRVRASPSNASRVLFDTYLQEAQASWVWG